MLKWKPNVHRITLDQMGRMEIATNNASGALYMFESTMNMAVYESTETQKKIEQDAGAGEKKEELRNMLSPLAMEQTAKLVREKAAAGGASSAEVEEKVKLAIEPQKKRIEEQIVRREKQAAREGNSSSEARAGSTSYCDADVEKFGAHDGTIPKSRCINWSVCGSDCLRLDQYAKACANKE